MIEIIKSDIAIKFTSKFVLTNILSTVVVIAAVVLFFTKGLNYGVDFRGGAEIQVKFTQNIDLAKLRKELSDGGFKSAAVQSIGSVEEKEYLIKVRADEKNLNEVTDAITQMLASKFSKEQAEIRKTDIVGPKAGAELRKSGFQAMIWALIAIMIYIALRFDFKYSPGAIVALIHDVSIIIGIFVITQTEFTLQIVAALLAVIGYSVNDTVVVYDRVREHENKFAGKKISEHINNAINETLSRTILTSGTTLFICMAMLFFGGQSIHDFFFAITLGVFIGTYSSIFIAAPVTMFFDKIKKVNA